MNKFVDFPLQQLLNRDNIFSRVEHLERGGTANPSAKVNRLDQLSQNTGDLVISGSLVVYDPETGLANVTLNETNPETGTEAGMVLRNGVSSVNFANTSGYAGNMFIYATTDNNIGIYNFEDRKIVWLVVQLTDDTLATVRFREHATVDNKTHFSVSAGSAGSYIDLGGFIIDDGVITTGSINTTDSITVTTVTATTVTANTLNLPSGLDTIIFDTDNPLSDGWWLTTDTCTQTGAYTFTLPGDFESEYRKGAKFACLNSTAKYGVIYSSAYVTTDDQTTITLIPNTDYALTTDAITVPQLSYIENPIGFPQWFNYDANPQGFSVVPSSPVYRWSTRANKIDILYSESNNGTSNATTFTATVPIASVYAVTGVSGTLVDNGSLLTTAGRWTISASASSVTFRTNMSTGAWTNANGKRAVAMISYEF